MAKWCLAHSKVTLVMMNIHSNSRLARFRIDIALDKRWPCHIESAGCLIKMSSAIPQLDFCKPVFPYPIAVILSRRLCAIFWIVGSAMSIWERTARIINEVTLYVYQKVKWMNRNKAKKFAKQPASKVVKGSKEFLDLLSKDLLTIMFHKIVFPSGCLHPKSF